MKDTDSRKSTKNHILEALLKLMKKTSLREITVKEIAWEAGVSRRTFYSYYSSKEQLLTEHSLELVESFKNDYNQNHSPDSMSFLKLFCGFWYENMIYFKAILNDPDINPIVLFKDIYTTIFGQKKFRTPGMEEFDSDQLHNFINGGLYYIIWKWITSETPESPERMAALLYSFIRSLPGEHEEVHL